MDEFGSTPKQEKEPPSFSHSRQQKLETTMTQENSKAIRILMAEDSPTDAELARQAFKTGKLLNELTIVENGVEALAYVRKEGKYKDKQTPDVILLDLNMPKKDGREVLAELKADSKLKR